MGTRLGSKGQCIFFNTSSHCWGAIRFVAATKEGAVDLLEYTASLLGSSGRWILFKTLPDAGQLAHNQ